MSSDFSPQQIDEMRTEQLVEQAKRAREAMYALVAKEGKRKAVRRMRHDGFSRKGPTKMRVNR